MITYNTPMIEHPMHEALGVVSGIGTLAVKKHLGHEE